MNASDTNDPVVDAGFVLHWLRLAARDVEHEADRLTDLDSAIGDADHGTNMRRGFGAALAAVDAVDAVDAMDKDTPRTPGGVLTLVGRQLISSVGGASGPLYGTLLRTAGKRLGDEPAVTGRQLAEALRAGLDGVTRLGRAEPGDKTMVDALGPALDALDAALEAGEGLADALRAAHAAADEGTAATVPLRARKGRASYLGERSVGHQDPGATSCALLVGAFAATARDLAVPSGGGAG